MNVEQKALELVNAVYRERHGLDIRIRIDRSVAYKDEALCRAIEAHEADKARHAAEMREQAERFSEAAKRTIEAFKVHSPERKAAKTILSPFIIPQPDPLVEAVTDALQEADCDAAADWTLQGGKAFISALNKRGYAVGPIVAKGGE